MEKIKCFFKMFMMVVLLQYPMMSLADDGKTLLSENTFVLDELIVTATRTESKLIESPSNISLLNAEDLAAMDARTVADALKKLPGVTYSNASGLEPKVSLRATRMGMSAGALVLLNGIPINLGKFGYVDWESLPVENIERVEVVKGPMSALYGGESSRGVINIITKKSEDLFSGNVSVTLGDNNDQRLSAVIHGSNGKWDYNFNAKKRAQDGYSDGTEIDSNYFNGEAGYALSEETRIGAYINITDKNRILAKKLTREQREEDPRQATDLSDTDNMDTIFGLNLDTKKQAYTVSTTLYYKNRDKHYENYIKANDSTPYLEELTEDVYGVRSILTLKQPLLGKKNFLSVGFDYDQDDSDLETTKAASKDASLPYTEPDPKKSGDFSRRELGVFIQDEFSIVENLTLTLGLRYDSFGFDNDADYDFSEGGEYDYDTSPSYDKWNPRISFNYRPINGLSVFGGYSRSYRAPSIYDYYASGSYSAKNAYTLEPESYTQWEGGIRYAFSRWLTTEATVFHVVIEEMLDSAYDETGKYMGKQNVNETTSKGLELSFSGTPAEWFGYTVSYTYTDARYSGDFYSKADSSTVVNINGNRLTKVPYNVLSVDTDFRLLKLDNFEMRWHINLQAQDEYRMDAAGNEEYPSYTLVNTKLQFKFLSFEAFVSADNLLDDDYDNYAYSSYGTEYFYPADGITWAFGISYHF